jgi:hypothetical protein
MPVNKKNHGHPWLRLRSLAEIRLDYAATGAKRKNGTTGSANVRGTADLDQAL